MRSSDRHGLACSERRRRVGGRRGRSAGAASAPVRASSSLPRQSLTPPTGEPPCWVISEARLGDEPRGPRCVPGTITWWQDYRSCLKVLARLTGAESDTKPPSLSETLDRAIAALPRLRSRLSRAPRFAPIGQCSRWRTPRVRHEEAAGHVRIGVHVGSRPFPLGNPAMPSPAGAIVWTSRVEAHDSTSAGRPVVLRENPQFAENLGAIRTNFRPIRTYYARAWVAAHRSSEAER